MAGNIDYFAKPRPQRGRYPWTDFDDPDPRPVYKTLAILRDWDMTLTHLHALALEDNLKGQSQIWEAVNDLCTKLSAIFKDIADEIKTLDGDALTDALNSFISVLENTLRDIYKSLVELVEALEGVLEFVSEKLIEHDKDIQNIITYISDLTDLVGATFDIEENYTSIESPAIECPAGFELPGIGWQPFWRNDLGAGVLVTYYDEVTNYNGKKWHKMTIRIRSTPSNGIRTASNIATGAEYWGFPSDEDSTSPKFRHSHKLEDFPAPYYECVVFTWEIPDEWKNYLTAETLKSVTQYGNMIWNMRPASMRASWDVHCDAEIKNNKVWIEMVSISDGYNAQFSGDYYDYTKATGNNGFHCASTNIQLELVFSYVEDVEE